MERFSLRRFLYAQLAFLCVLALGTAGFQAILGEGWVDSFYRAVVTTTLAGLDSKPQGTGAEIFSIVLLLAGVAIFLYIAGAIVELIARGVLEDVVGERRRRRASERMRGHTIICGFGRAGRRMGVEFLASGHPFVAIRHRDGRSDATPSPDAEFQAGDVVIGVGTSEELRLLEQLFAPREAAGVG